MSKTGKRRKSRRVSSSSIDGNDWAKLSREKDVTSHRKKAKKRHREKSQERTMSKKGKRRKTRKLSSSPSDGSKKEKASHEKDVTSHQKGAKKRHHEKSQERSAEKPGISASLPGKDGSRSDRLIKKPVYKLTKVQPIDKKLACKKEESTKTETVFVPSHMDNCSGKGNVYISEKDTNVSARHTVATGSSKHQRTGNIGTVTEKTKKQSSPRSHSRSKNDRISLDSDKQKDHRQTSVKRSGRTEEPRRAKKDSNMIKSREMGKISSHPKESLREKKREHQENVKTKTHPCTTSKIPYSTAEKDSSIKKSKETGTRASYSKESPREQKREHQENMKTKTHPCTTSKIPYSTAEKDSSIIKSKGTGRHASYSKESPREQKREHQENVKVTPSPCTITKIPCSIAEKNSSIIKSKETGRSLSYAKESPMEKKKEHQENVIAITSPWATSKIPCSTATEPTGTLETPTTSDSTASLLNRFTRVPEDATSAPQKIPSYSPTVPLTFKMAKKPRPWSCSRPVSSKQSVSTNKHVKHATEQSDSGASVDNSARGIVPHVQHSSDFAPSASTERQDWRSSLSDQDPSQCNTNTLPWHHEMQVAEELHLARCEKRLEVNLKESYGELTCMDIDPPAEGATDSLTKKPLQQGLLLVLDTNVLLSHLDYVKTIKGHGLGALGFPIVLIPWVVLQELDSLKRAKNISGSVAHLATPAISFIYNSLKQQDPHLWGQSMQQASESSDGLNVENNDDRVLQCCLQYQRLYPECALILCTNDKNLCSKALLSGVKALSKDDLVGEVGKAGCGLSPHTTVLPHCGFQVSVSSLSRGSTPVTSHFQDSTQLSLGHIGNENMRLHEEANEKTSWELSLCLSELQNCLHDVLSKVLEAEMKTAYEDLWLEIVCVKPPWTLRDILHCLKKHWIAVFGQIVPRNMLQIVLNLTEFFTSDKRVERNTTIRLLLEVKELLKAFGKRSVQVSSAVSVLDNIFHKLQPQREFDSLACDVVMNDDEDKDPISCLVSNQEVWTLFENIWTRTCQMSLEVFKALGFDPSAMQSALPAGRTPPPQDALACLHKLHSVVSQLLQAFSSVLSSTSGLEEVQALFNIIQSTKIVPLDFRLTAKHLLDCFSHEEYRERLRVGGTQLMELKMTLQRCVEAAGQRSSFMALL
ncbi:transcriptional protein SWT1 [Thalassophryne amazonica]|uniref:transcriptional protein SWT1 n=1 Tax=Thalassophryne amazonica TaxID=390379 RepID=UPI0014725A10|nr:transcriptional protein SWT1 [Thalassophryne amazonica]